MRVKRTGVDHLGHDLVDRASSNQAHVHLELVLVPSQFDITRSYKEVTYPEDLDGLLNAVLAIAAERVEKWPADTDSLRPKREGLEHVACAAHTAVDEELEFLVREAQAAFLLQVGHNLHEHLDAGPGKVQLAASVVGKNHPCEAEIIGFKSIFPSLNTLQYQWHWKKGW